jgi:hypothetical protein
MFPPAARSPAGRDRPGTISRCGKTVGQSGARRAEVEPCRQQGGVAAVAAHRRSQRKAGERDDLTRARASVDEGDAISILGSVEEVAEGCCRRRGQARAAPVKGGSGWG